MPKALRESLTEEQQTVYRKAFNEALKSCAGAEASQKAWDIAKGVTVSDWSRTVKIAKTDDDKMLAFGWLSVAFDKDGDQIEDCQGDIIEEDDLEKAVYDYVLYARQAGEVHQKIGVGRLVESMMFTKEKQEALGIPEGILPVGWWVGFKVDDVDVWQKIKDGTYKMFSIGGVGQREEVTDDDDQT